MKCCLLFLYLCIFFIGIKGRIKGNDCTSKPPDLLEFQAEEGLLVHEIDWSLENNTCSSFSSCFSSQVTIDHPLEIQLKPNQFIDGTQLRFININKTLNIFWVTEREFMSCTFLQQRNLSQSMVDIYSTINHKFLRLGVNYFIAAIASDEYQNSCKDGMRINITMKYQTCMQPGLQDICNKRGMCLTSIHEDSYKCHCCNTFEGEYCELFNACISNPCRNHGQCIEKFDNRGMSMFSCTCPLGFLGTMCESQVENLCDLKLCENNGSCKGNSNYFECKCRAGFTGTHCEININECASSPCVHGVCMDKENGYQCFCIPGHGGIHCEETYSECLSSPCKNGGFCKDLQTGWECHCGQGFEGEDCSTKKKLCDPSPCMNATECIDYGNTVSCTCKPGFTGIHCEIDINECASSPCLNHGSCYDESSGYRCVCPAGVTGVHCELSMWSRGHNPSSFIGFPALSRHHNHLHNLSIVAGTLAGALLIALMVLAGCYCRLYGLYRVCPQQNFKYKKQRTSDKRDCEHFPVCASMREARPTMEAILDAMPTAYNDTINAPLMHSLKPRKI